MLQFRSRPTHKRKSYHPLNSNLGSSLFGLSIEAAMPRAGEPSVDAKLDLGICEITNEFHPSKF
jgi:hypothetical protein